MRNWGQARHKRRSQITKKSNSWGDGPPSSRKRRETGHRELSNQQESMVKEKGKFGTHAFNKRGTKGERVRGDAKKEKKP